MPIQIQIKTALKQLPKPHKWALSALLLVLCLLFLTPTDPASASRHTDATELELGIRYTLSIPTETLNNQPQQAIDQQPQQRSYKIRNGDNLAKIFKRAGLTPQETYHVSRAGKDAQKLLRMMPGEQLTISTDANGQLLTLSYPYSTTDTLIIARSNNNKFSSQINTRSVDTRLNFAQGEIENSFWNAGIKAKLSEKHIMSLAGIFGWDIDFALEIRQGDNFNVIFEEQYIDGEFIGHGSIVAAEFVNQGETFQAIRYKDGNYYTPEGRSMRKSFLRAPVNFKYISSNFTKKRFHPVQKRWKAHRGTDYAADRGTPVMAAGDGKVIRSRYDKYNGHHVFIQHGERYTTKYLHFTKRKVKTGQLVKQGQIIGTVGSTGLAAGPHLHYEFLVDGVHRNPRTVALPKAKPIKSSESEDFKLLAAQRLQQLRNNKRIMLAMN